MNTGNRTDLLSPRSLVYGALGIALACRTELPAPKRYATECAGSPPGVDLPAQLRDSLRTSTSEYAIRSKAIAGRFPTYGGYGYRGQFFQFWFTDTTAGRALLDTIVRLEKIENRDSLPFQLSQVRWNYSQLEDWYNYLSPRLMKTKNVWMSGVDLLANRIIFHVSDTVARHVADSQLVAWNVPCGLVRLQLPKR